MRISPGRWMRLTIARTLWLIVTSAAAKAWWTPAFGATDVAQLVVLEANHGIGDFLEARQRLFRLGHPAFAFESERQRGKADDHRSGFPRESGDHRSARRSRFRRRARRRQKSCARSPRRGPHFIGRFDRGVVADLRITARAQDRACPSGRAAPCSPRRNWRAIAHPCWQRSGPPSPGRRARCDRARSIRRRRRR